MMLKISQQWILIWLLIRKANPAAVKFMSGGEKTSPPLSVLFCAATLSSSSPSTPFDEVDMFLDGANVERLAK